MSIATLKKKTQAEYNRMSVNQQQFSLNGTRRSQGYVGQTSLSRSLPRTLMKGSYECGYGGHEGQFIITPIVQSGIVSLNNPNVIKPSVKNTLGMIESKYRWIKRPYPNSTTKPDTTLNSNSQGQYTMIKKYQTLQEVNDLRNENIRLENIANGTDRDIVNKKTYGSNDPFCNNSKYFNKKKTNYVSTTPSTFFTSVHSSDYMEYINSGVTNYCKNKNTFYVQNNLLNLPFGHTAQPFLCHEVDHEYYKSCRTPKFRYTYTKI